MKKVDTDEIGLDFKKSANHFFSSFKEIEKNDSPKAAIEKNNEVVLSHIKKMAQKISANTENPGEIEAELDQYAEQLSESNLLAIQNILLHEKINGDLAALSLDLLGRTHNPLAERILSQYILEGPKLTTPESSMLQALALESLIQQVQRSQNTQYLTSLEKDSHHLFIRQRATQAKLALEGKAPALLESDNENLKKLLEKSAR